MLRCKADGGQPANFDLARTWASLLALAKSGPHANRPEQLRRAPRCVRSELAARCLDEYTVRSYSRGYWTQFFDEQDLCRDRPRAPIDGNG